MIKLVLTHKRPMKAVNPSTVALNKLYYFIPYIGSKCGQGFTGIRDLYLIKVARVGSRREGEIQKANHKCPLVFRNQVNHYKNYA